MTRGRIAQITAAAAVLGLIIGVIPDERRRLSIDLWLIVVALWAAIALARVALEEVPLEPGRLRLPFRIRTRPAPVEDAVPRDLATLRGTVQASIHHPRAFRFRMRTHLRELAGHRFRVDHGIDLDREPERVGAILGDAGWLIDEHHPDRTPTTGELLDFLDRLETEPAIPTAPTGPTGSIESRGRRTAHDPSRRPPTRRCRTTPSRADGRR